MQHRAASTEFATREASSTPIQLDLSVQKQTRIPSLSSKPDAFHATTRSESPSFPLVEVLPVQSASILCPLELCLRLLDLGFTLLKFLLGLFVLALCFFVLALCFFALFHGFDLRSCSFLDAVRHAFITCAAVRVWCEGAERCAVEAQRNDFLLEEGKPSQCLRWSYLAPGWEHGDVAFRGGRQRCYERHRLTRR